MGGSPILYTRKLIIMSSASSDNTSITLTKFDTNKTDLSWLANISGFPVKVNASGTGLLDGGHIFVMQLTGTGLDPNQGDMFNRIASVQDITDLPTIETIDQMNEDDIQGLISPFYRTNQIELFFETPDLAERGWQIIKSDAQLLVDNLKLMDEVQPSETVTIS